MIANIYREWNKEAPTNLQNLVEMLRGLCLDKELSLVMAGDFNLDFSRVEDTQYQHRQAAAFLAKNFLQLSMEVTRFGITFHRNVKGQAWRSSLDWLVTSSDLSNFARDTKTQNLQDSDHYPITWKLVVNRRKARRLTKTFRNLKKINKQTCISISSCKLSMGVFCDQKCPQASPTIG